MSLMPLLSGLKQAGVRIRLAAGQLKLHAPGGSVPPALLAELKKRKDEVVAFLRKNVRGPSLYAALELAEEKEYHVLSPAQKRLYLLHRLDPGNIGYNMPYLLLVEDRLDRQRISNCFRQLIKRHESLRTSFHMIRGEPVQKIHTAAEVNIDIEYRSCPGNSEMAGGDTPGPASRQTQRKTHKDFIDEFVRPFDLSGAPLLRVGLIELGQKKHILMVDLHHIVGDGVSQVLLAGEFTALYGGGNLRPARLQYKDYCGWMQSGAVRKALEKQEKYWLEQLRGEIPLLDLPCDYPRPGTRGFVGKEVAFQINGTQTGALEELARSRDVTLFMLFLAIYDVFLAKISNQEEVILGIPTAGRRHADLEAIVGVFINTLVMRNRPAGEKTFDAFLAEVREHTLQAFENQEYPFEDLVEKVGVRRDMSRNPLFDTMLMFQNFRPDALPEAWAAQPDRSLNVRPYPYENRTARFDLTLVAGKSGGKLICTFEYAVDLFKSETVSRFIDYFCQVVASVSADPQQKIAHIEILTPAEKRRLLMDFNATETRYPQDKTVHAVFAEQAAKSPDRIALTGSSEDGWENVSLTYNELNRKVEQFALLLQKKGLEAGSVVALMMERRVGLFIGLLGILKVGAAYLPLDPHYPPQRISYILDKSGSTLLVTDNHGLKKIDRNRVGDLQILLLKDGPGRVGADCGESATPVATNGTSPVYRPACAHDPAYVIYTSGSTGNPKGVTIRHYNVMNFIAGMRQRIDFVAPKTILALTTISFDIFVLESLLPLTCGMRVVSADEERQQDPRLLARLIEGRKVRMLQVTPSRLDLLTTTDPQLRCLDGVVELMVGGEAFPVPLFNKLKELFKGKIYNMYGPTETTVWSAVKDLTDQDRITIGGPIANTQVYIVDRFMKPQPPGVVGELYIGGDGVAAGYLNNPVLTSERFITRPPTLTWDGGAKAPPSHVAKGVFDDHPSSRSYAGSAKAPPSHVTKGDFDDRRPTLSRGGDAGAPTSHEDKDPGEPRIYRTGDLARWLTCGDIEFLGRVDHQVKVRGFRIELEEIEERLSNYEGIEQAVVVARKDDNGENTLCAYLVGPNEAPQQGELRSFLGRHLPEYMIPTYFTTLEQMPLTPNGKVDRTALPQPRFLAGNDYLAPRDQWEQKLAEIWSQVLGVDINLIGVHANFFQLGGQSLRATSMVNRIDLEWGVKVPLAKVFKNPTLAGVAELARGLARCGDTTVGRAEEKEYYVLSSAQKRMFVLHQMDKADTRYNMPLFLELKGNLDRDRLNDSLWELIRRHEVLRTGFFVHRHQPVQKVHAAADIDFTPCYHDANSVQKHGIDKIVDEFIHPFDLSRAPLLRVALAAVGPKNHLWMIDMHHIVSDGVSFGLLIKDFLALYGGREIPPLRLHYKDFAEWQNRSASVGEIKKQQDYWLNRFRGDIPKLNLTTDYPGDSGRSPVLGGYIGFKLEKPMTAGLDRLVQKTGATVYMILLAVFYILLSKYSKQDDIVVGTPIAGRKHPDLEPIIGMFVNMLAMRNFPKEEKTFDRFLLEVKENCLDAFDNQDYQFEELVRKLGIVEHTRNPLCNVVFVSQKVDLAPQIDTPIIDGLQVGPYPYDDNTVKFDLQLEITEAGDFVNMLLNYRKSLFKPSSMERLVKHYMEILEQVLESTQIKLMDISISHDLVRAQTTMPRESEITFGF